MLSKFSKSWVALVVGVLFVAGVLLGFLGAPIWAPILLLAAACLFLIPPIVGRRKKV